MILHPLLKRNFSLPYGWSCLRCRSLKIWHMRRCAERLHPALEFQQRITEHLRTCGGFLVSVQTCRDTGPTLLCCLHAYTHISARSRSPAANLWMHGIHMHAPCNSLQEVQYHFSKKKPVPFFFYYCERGRGSKM